jgi:PiT family inorganic phosphate transporter
MATAWLLTLPSAGVVGALSYALASGIGGDAGVLVVLAVLVAIGIFIYLRSRRTAVRHDNVNAEWAGSVAPPESDKAAAPVAA